MVFTATFDSLDFPVKTVKFSCKNRQIFFKKLKRRRKSLHFYFPQRWRISADLDFQKAPEIKISGDCSLRSFNITNTE